MKTTLSLLALLLTTQIAIAAPATPFKGYADDRHLSAGAKILDEVPLELAPDQIVWVPDLPEGVQVLREEHGQTREVAGMVFNTVSDECSTIGKKTVSATLETPYFAVTNWEGNYKITAKVPCFGFFQFVFRQSTPGGQAVGVWEVAITAKNKLEAAVGLDFWKSPIQLVWPADGDYYSYGVVNVTAGHQWDVVGHELGHAIYDLANVGAFGGGQHKIDECYSNALALSEGWASYFSAWLRVGLDDADAKFEYMVPRRAPLRFENIPADVCKGPTNEWRVTGFFWDLIDLNQDGESSEAAFREVWEALYNSESSSAKAAKDKLRGKGFNETLLETVWALNFLQ